MTRIIQVNLNRCKAAQHLLLQTATEKKADVMIISEQNKTLPHWYSDTDGKSAIAMHQAITPEEVGNPGQGYAWVRVQGIRIYSCYVSPNITMDDFRDYLDRLETSIRAGCGEVILAGDFNAKNAEWGSNSNDQRGTELAELIASLDLHVCNVGSSPTFERGSSSSILDLTFASPRIANLTIDWKVLEEETMSDHKYITFMIGAQTRTQDQLQIGWCRKKLDPQKLQKYLDDREPPQNAQDLMETIKGACDAAMPRTRSTQNYRKPQHWWTSEIAELRKAALAARRKYQRAARRGPADAENHTFKDARKGLRLAIKRSQDTCWRKLCNEVNHNPWGTAYKMVMRKIGRRPAIPTNLIPKIVSELFPTHDSVERTAEQVTASVPPITLEELEVASRRLHPGKAPGPDGVPNEALKVAVRTHPAMFQGVYERCMKDGVFPKPWKMARLVLLKKGDKPADQPSSYRPLCMLDTTGKLFERILCNRIEEALASKGTGLAENQYGFRKGRSTIDAINRVMAEVSDAGKGTIYERQLCVLITLDVANAFNSASWEAILNAIAEKKVPGYLTSVVRNYLCDREVTHAESQETINLTSGVPQGSVLGPLLWGVMYDGLLTEKMPEGITMVGFADDVAIVGRSWRVDHLEDIVNKALGAVHKWMTEHQLRLATHKTEAVMLTRKKGYRKPTFVVGGHQVTTKNSLKYLGVEIDSGRRFKVHEQAIGHKATRTAQALSRILPNIGGSTTAKRKLLASVVHSQLLYAAPVWEPLLDHRPDSVVPLKGDTAKNMKAAQRIMALRVTRAYRTVSFEAVTLLAAMPPIMLLAKERTAVQNANNKSQALQDARRGTMVTWQQNWENAVKGRWTYTLIRDVEKWVNRRYGETDYFLTQALTNHGCFNAYLHKIKKAASPKCSMCDAEIDDAKHTLFECDAYENWRQHLYAEIGHTLTPQDLIETMLKGKEIWDLIAAYIHRVMEHKCAAERTRQAAAT